ncbi:3-isopropylmalate dehydratase small subunit [Rhizorhabdus wittichii]|uniref:3-isopropylmalate dehydratase small subunit n=1 Tax=Rhizorhabdus wittichii TaxID=160791 RepID=A0A975HCA3_9SPHN|nr:3-isopropylmalate dehydratase small subunit [Rhizorhabdus wittichii]QTH20176.1 3-isopropylmalate dehydratase small subunit [Rhizorhabdus wittichii]
MDSISILRGPAIPLGLKNVDTDLIIPSRYLKTVTRHGLGKGAFSALREDPDNLFNQPRYNNAPILITGDNFGCGSSREHAPWALVDLGIRVVIAPSFADIFAGNAFKNGILLVELSQRYIDRLLAAADADILVDLERQIVATSYCDEFAFEIDPFRKRCLLEGLDEIDLTLSLGNAVDSYELWLAANRSWLGARRH